MSTVQLLRFGFNGFHTALCLPNKLYLLKPTTTMERIRCRALLHAAFVACMLCLLVQESLAFRSTLVPSSSSHRRLSSIGRPAPRPTDLVPTLSTTPSSPTALHMQDLAVIGLVAGQENYGLAVVCIGEALWSFLQAPSLSHVKVLIPAAVAAVVLVAVSGPMITSGVASSVGSGLWIATGVSVGLGASYAARMLAPFSPSPKEIAALGLLVAVAGFFSFSQNLVVDGFVTLPSLPSLPSFELPELNL